jgi:hypothetical protein
MLKDEIIKYRISEHIILKVIKTTLLGITVKTTCYLIDEKDNIKRII